MPFRLWRAVTQPRRALGCMRAAVRDPVVFARAARAVYLQSAAQKPLELFELGRLVRSLRPRHVLEIGSFRGGTLQLWSALATPDATLITVDLPFEKPNPPGPRFGHIGRSSQRVVEIREDSHSPEAKRRVAEVLVDERLDFLFIDGDHSYEGVSADYRDYGRLVREGGLIAFHDIIPHPKHPDYGVSRFWSEIARETPSQALIDRVHRRAGMGIGVIRVERARGAGGEF